MGVKYIIICFIINNKWLGDFYGNGRVRFMRGGLSC